MLYQHRWIKKHEENIFSLFPEFGVNGGGEECGLISVFWQEGC